MPRIEAGGSATAPNPHSSKPHRRIEPGGPWVAIDDCECLNETEKAILVWIDDDSYWFPKSHVGADSEIWRKGQKGKLIVSEWIAIQKGLLDMTTRKRSKLSAKPELAEPYKLYRQLIRKYHPDLNPAPWAQEVAKDLTTLWREVLKAGGNR